MSNNNQQTQNVILNMRVTANSTQGHRKYMEDCYKIRFQRESSDSTRNLHEKTRTQNESTPSDILFSYFAIFDGHGGKEASHYCKEKLYWKIIESDDFWSDNDSQILNAIRNGFVKCHMEMWNELPNWPKTPSGLPSTSGTTATVLFIKKSKAYVGHVGDSGLVIGFTREASNQLNSTDLAWFGKKLTRDHKPEDPIELKRIQNAGGSVMSKSGVNRVVWNRPVFNSTQINLKKSQSNSNLTPYEINYLKNQRNVQTERVPFLAVARSLGDLWSYNVSHDEFVVSPVPDVFSFDLDPRVHKCLILATDGLWNVLKPSETVEFVRQTDKETENLISKSMSVKSGSKSVQPFVNPSQRLVNTAMQRCCEKMIRADNTTCITIMLDQPVDFANEFDFNSTQDIMNKTNFEKLLKQNKTFDYSRRCNDSDQFDDDDYDELDDEDDNPEDQDEEDEEKLKFTKTFSGQMLTSSTISDFNTPISNDKRSRSLISLRRRHWSGSSSACKNDRSTSACSTKTDRNQFINIQDRNRRNTQRTNEQNGTNFKPVYNTANSNRHPKPTGLHLNQNKSNINTVNQSRANLNVSSVSAINKFSKNLRKSFNDLYTATSNKFTTSSTTAAQSEVANKNKLDESSKENGAEQSPANGYAKRLRKFKNRLIKTKNNFLQRKRKLFNEPVGNFRRKSISSPNLKNLNIKCSSEDPKDKNFLNSTSAPSNQSFVNNMRSKLNNLKRNQSAKQLNSTTLTTSAKHTIELDQTPSKRAKFY